MIGRIEQSLYIPLYGKTIANKEDHALQAPAAESARGAGGLLHFRQFFVPRLSSPVPRLTSSVSRKPLGDPMGAAAPLAGGGGILKGTAPAQVPLSAFLW